MLTRSFYISLLGLLTVIGADSRGQDDAGRTSQSEEAHGSPATTRTAAAKLTSRVVGQFRELQHQQMPHSQHVIYSAQINLSNDGLWQIKSVDHPGITEFYLRPTKSLSAKRLGRRMMAAEQDQLTQRGRWTLRTAYQACRRYAKEHQGKGPPSIEAINLENYAYLQDQWREMPWQGHILASYVDGPVEGPFRFLAPNVTFGFTGNVDNRFEVNREQRQILAVELRPFQDDGKHWVAYTDGTVVREEPNPEFFDKHSLELKPVITKEFWRRLQESRTVTYELTMVASKQPETASTRDRGGKFDLRLTNSVVREEQVVSLDLGQSDGGSDVLGKLKMGRHAIWQPYIAAGGGSILSNWKRNRTAEVANEARTTSIFSILGGRAAIEETLQMQGLVASADNGPADVDLGEIEGVSVKAHPYKEMLAGAPGGRLHLANFVPHDRFFVYLAQPEAFRPFLNSGASFISDVGAVLSGNRLDYGLGQRYLKRLGLSRSLVQNLLEAEVLEDVALVTPDLLFIDGTDITIVARMKHPKLLSTLVGLSGAKTIERPTETGTAHWTMQDELLIVSTSRNEMQRCQQLAESQGEGSLGQSDEFRYMLTKLAVDRESLLYAYFSDPFVRRIVGPEVKLGQRRRLLARASLETLASQFLLAQLDGVEVASIRDLIAAGYIPAGWDNGDLSIDEQGHAESRQWGSLARLNSLLDVPLSKVTEAERDAYGRYRQNYSRYWRQFFDPIAIRLSATGADEYELSTFILPLVDNSIYNGLRRVLAHGSEQHELQIPQLEPKPILQFSMNLQEEAWTEIASNFSEFFSEYSGVSSAILDDFGSGVHIALHDADPVLALGSGDVLGAFGGNTLRNAGNEMLLLPVVLSAFTRPCTILVETSDPEQTARYLRLSAAGGGHSARGGWFRSAFYQVEDRDEWVWNMDLLGMAKLRFGVRVAENYLVIRNIPWSQRDEIAETWKAELNAAQITIHPEACQLQLPGLHAAASDSNRRSVLSGIGRLYPVLLSNPGISISDAQAIHERLFGFQPRLLPTDKWNWASQELRSAEYGTPMQPKQPAYRPGEPFGLLQRIKSAELNMQFEDDGLRSSVHWSVKR